MDINQLRAIVNRVQTLSQRLSADGPQTDDELHAWVRVNIGVDIPRVAVCKDHDPPFKVLADCYFERVGSILVLANRDGAKTFIIAILHYLNATYKPGCGCISFGATKAQGDRCYSNIENWCYEHDPDTGKRVNVVHDWIDGDPLKSETKWKNGSKVSVIPGSVAAVSGPHDPKAHADEVDIMEDPVWDQSRGIATAQKANGNLPAFMHSFDGIIPPQDLVTSTRNSLKGRMHQLLKEVEEDVRNGDIPQFTSYKWCIFECAREVPHCRAVSKKKRESRLVELGRDPKELCQCHRVRKGHWPDGTPRTLESVCAQDDHHPRGGFFYSRGWKPYIDLVITFKRNPRGVWTLQHECREGTDENNYITDWALSLFGIRNYTPRPEYGPIYQGIDWGSDAPHAVLWYQLLRVEIPAWDFNYEPIWIEPKVYVAFNELYLAGIDASILADRVINVEDEYREKYGSDWKVEARFADPAGKGERLIWNRKGLKTTWPVVTRDKKRMISTVQNIVEEDRWLIDADRCEVFNEEVEGWHKDPRTKEEARRQRNHLMSAWRYGVSNSEVKEGMMDPISDNEPNRKEREEEKSNRVRISGADTPSDVDAEQYGPVAVIGGNNEGILPGV